MKDKARIILNRDSLLVLLIIFVAIFLAKFPTVYNWLDTPNGYFYAKQASWFDSWDTNFQVGDIRYGQKYGLALKNFYTTIPHNGVYVYQFYTILGVFNRFLNLDPFILFHLASILSSIFLIIVSFFISRLFFKEKLYQVSAFILFVLGGGLGWYFVEKSADTAIAGFTMVNAFERGHDSLSTAFLLLFFYSLYKFITSQKNYWQVLSVLFSVLNFTFHPPLIAVHLLISGIITLWFYLREKKIIFITCLILLFFGLYYLLILKKFISNSAFSGVVNQEIIGLNSFSLILGFGVLSFFIFWQILFVKKHKLETSFILLFFITQLIFTFSPLGFHLYYVKGLHIWGVLLGIFGIKEFFQNTKVQGVVLTAIVVVSLVTRVYVFNTVMNPQADNQNFFLQEAEGKVLEFIAKNIYEKAFLSLYRIGNYIPAHSFNKVYFGHNFLTPNSAEKLKMAFSFYTELSKEQQLKFLKENYIDFIYYGFEEKSLRDENGMAVENPFPYFNKIYDNNGIIIYKVDKTVIN